MSDNQKFTEFRVCYPSKDNISMSVCLNLGNESPDMQFFYEGRIHGVSFGEGENINALGWFLKSVDHNPTEEVLAVFDKFLKQEPLVFGERKSPYFPTLVVRKFEDSQQVFPECNRLRPNREDGVLYASLMHKDKLGQPEYAQTLEDCAGAMGERWGMNVFPSQCASELEKQ